MRRQWARRYLGRLDRLDFRDSLMITLMSGLAIGNSEALWLDGPHRIGDFLALLPLFLVGAFLAFVAPLGVVGRWLYLRHRATRRRQA